MKKKTLIWIAIAVAVVALIGYFSSRKKETFVTLGGVQKGDIEELISASGAIESETLVKISSEISGEVTDIFVDIGDSVRVGQPLVRIRPDNFKSAADRARATLQAQESQESQSRTAIAQAELRLSRAKQDLARIQRLVDKEVASGADLLAAQNTYDLAVRDLESAKSQAAAARFQVQSAAATLRDAQLTLSRTEILSPLNGSVLNVISKKGERVVGTAQMAGTTIMSLAAITDLQVRVQINENDVNRIKVGQEVRIRVDAAEDTVFKGYVRKVSNINKDKPTPEAVTEYEAILALPYRLNGPKLKMLKIGMSASADILTNSKTGVLIAPVQAVLFKTDSTKPNPDGSYPDYEYVYTYKAGKVHKKVVKTGISNSAMIEIATGLTQGDSLVTGPFDVLNNKLKDGAEVAKQPQNQR